MKYAPLVWSALWHKPAEAVLTWLTVTIAFALFGLMLGVNATLQSYIDSAPDDVLSVYARFPSARLHVGMREQIERIDGVSATAVLFILNGYHTDPRNAVTVITVDNRGSEATPQFRLKPADWQRLFATPDGLYVSEKAAARWNLEPGDTFIVNARRPGLREDGTSAWPFRVLDIVPDVPDSEGFLIGNFNYVDQARPLQSQGRDVMFQVLVGDATRALDVSRRIDRLFANSGTPTFSISQRHASQNMANSSGHRTLATSLVGAAGLFMILLLIANGIAQSVRERAPQLAVLRALGFQNIHIMGLVLGEVAIPCLAGAILGTFLARQLAGWPLKFLPGDFAYLPPPTISLSVMLWALAFGALLAVASAVVPLIRVRRMSVVNQLAGLAR